MRRDRFVALIVGALVVGVSAPIAQAQFYRSLFRGVSRLSAPSAPSALRFGQLRVSQEPFMDGWRLDFNRSFGPDAVGRPNRIDLGPFDLTFNAGQVSTSAQFSRRFIPMAEFSSATPQAISYSVSLNTGLQDFNIDNAQLAFSTNWSINALGFYDYALTVSHRGDFEVDGMALVDHGTLDFDVGPINLSGNLVGDLLAAVTEPLFSATGQDNPFALFSGRATKTIEVQRTRDELTSRVRTGETLSEGEFDELMEATLVAAALDGTIPDFSFLADEEFAPTLESIGVEFAEAELDGSLGAPDGAVPAPEPMTAMFVLLAGIVLVATRRRA